MIAAIEHTAGHKRRATGIYSSNDLRRTELTMRFHTYIPGPPLGNFVHSFWNSTYSQPDLRIRILPRGTAELVINLSQDEIRVYDSEPPNRCRRFPGIVFSGAYG